MRHDIHDQEWANATLDRSRLRAALAAREVALADAGQCMARYANSRLWRLTQQIQDKISARPWLHRSVRAITNLRQVWRGDRPSPGAVSLVLGSGLFDAAWYAARNPGAPRDPAAAATHYLSRSRYGALVDPGPAFDAAWYRRENPGIGAEDALLHYLRIGRHRLRATSAAGKAAAEAIRRQALGLDLPAPRLPVAIGFTTDAPRGLLARAIGSARIAAMQADLTDYALLWPGGREDAPADVEALSLPPAMQTGFAAHEQMVRRAAQMGARLYIAVDPAGFFAPDCLSALLRMSAAAADNAVIAATDFPNEHPRLMDPLRFDTPWAGGGCVLLPVALALQIGGFAPALRHLAWIDLSWRLRQAGARVMTCPNALYFTALAQTGASDWVAPEFLMDGYRLARLWGSADAAALIRAELARHGAALPEDAPDHLHRDPAGADWSFGFGFAPVRW